MGWDKERLRYFYTRGMLYAITRSYKNLYTVGIEIVIAVDIVARIGEPLSVMEFKADYDLALRSIGRGDWRGLTSPDFGYYKHFGKQQQTVIADLLGISDYELQGRGFYQIDQLRGSAYSRMLAFLNNSLPQIVRTE